MLAHLTEVNYIYFLPITLLLIIHYLLRAIRWRYLLAGSDAVSIQILFESLMLGNFATYILPLRAGEFIRPYALSMKSGYSFSSSFISVVVERFLDLMLVLLSFGGLLFFIENIPAWVHHGALILTFLAAAIFAMIVLGSFLPSLVLKIGGCCFLLLPQKFRYAADRLLQDFIAGTQVLKTPKNLFITVGLSLLVWLSCHVVYLLFLPLMNVESSLTLAVSISVIIALAVAAPSAPGFIGVFQTACVAAFALFGISKESAIAYSIVSHAFQFILIVGYGIFLLIKNNIRFADLMHRDEATTST